MPILNEVEYQYRTRLWSDIKQYVGKGYFIHFGQTPKMGVRVDGKFHNDPYGVYCYSLDWLVNARRFKNGEQFGINWPYWTIVERLPDDHGIILSKLTFDEVDDIAARNHWPRWEEFDRRRYENMRPPHNSPAGLFWDYIQKCSPIRVGSGNVMITQNAALKGISYIYDDGLGIIHGGEPYQMVVFDPRVIRVVARGDQGKSTDDTMMNGHRFAFVELLKKLRGEYGGNLNWNKKLPSLSFDVNGAHFNLTWFPSTMDSTLRMEVKWGRAEKTFSFSEGQFHIRKMDEVMKFFTDIVTKFSSLARAGKDIFFTPVITEKQAKESVLSLIDDSFEIRTEINNDIHEMTVMAEKTVKLGKTTMNVRVYCLNANDKLRYAANIRIGDYPVMSARLPEDPERLGPALKENFDKALEYVKPNTDYSRHFYYKEEYTAFVGMVADLSGIKSLKDNYADEVDFWRSFKDKNEIYREAARIY